MCGRATLRIELSTPCMMFAIMIESVIMPRLGTGTNGGTASPLTADAPWAASSRRAGHHMLTASSPFPGRLGCSRYRSGIREFWQARTSEAGGITLTSRHAHGDVELAATIRSLVDERRAIKAQAASRRYGPRQRQARLWAHGDAYPPAWKAYPS